MNRGYTKRWRKKWDRGYHQDPLLWVMMDYFIDFANYKETTVYCAGVGLVPLKRGQHIYSLRRLAELLNVDMGQIRRRLKILETIQFISIRTTNHFSIASVINYDLYQNQELMFDTPTDTPNDKQTAQARQTNDKQTTLPNKDKKDKKVKNDKKTTKADFVLPEWIDKDVWVEYKKYRQNGKGKFTPYAQELAITKLTELKADGNDPSEVLKQSIFRGWSGLFPLKDNYNKEESQEEWLKRVSQPR